MHEQNNKVTWCDSHCHLDFPDFAHDQAGVLARAQAAGLDRLVTIGTKRSNWAAVQSIAAQDEKIYCTIGVHPHEASQHTDVTVATLLEQAHNPKVVGLGETGLDYYYNKSTPQHQQLLFRRHIDACGQADLPLIIHARDADQDIATIMREEGVVPGGRVRGVMHCFSSSDALADAAMAMDFYFSFSGILTFKNAESIRAVAARVPLERLLLETDAPYLAPVPMRGQRNEPAFLVHTAKVLAEVRQLSLEALAAQTTTNFLRLFKRVAPCV